MAARERALDPTHVANVVAVVSQATPGELQAGMAWYPAYGEWAGRQAALHGFTHSQGRALFAACSPKSLIARNRQLLLIGLQRGGAAIPHFGRIKLQAAAILADRADPARHLTGPKVTAFYANLSGDYSRVTVDRHAASMVLGYSLTDKDSIGGPAYAYYERVIVAAAALLGIPPAEVQAVGWIVWRRLKGATDNGGMENGSWVA